MRNLRILQLLFFFLRCDCRMSEYCSGHGPIQVKSSDPWSHLAECHEVTYHLFHRMQHLCWLPLRLLFMSPTCQASASALVGGGQRGLWHRFPCFEAVLGLFCPFWRLAMGGRPSYKPRPKCIPPTLLRPQFSLFAYRDTEVAVSVDFPTI